MILAESHGVISSWHEERNILVDVFCCKKFDHKKFANDLAAYFKALVTTDELRERYLH